MAATQSPVRKSATPRQSHPEASAVAGAGSAFNCSHRPWTNSSFAPTPFASLGAPAVKGQGVAGLRMQVHSSRLTEAGGIMSGGHNLIAFANSAVDRAA